MKLTPEIINILQDARTDGNAVVLTGQLDRKLYTKVNDVLEALGGKWNRKAKAHIFECDAEDAIDQILVTGEVLTKKTIQQEFGFFPTPLPIAERAVDLAGVAPGMRVLEPSAGRGAIADLLALAGATVHCAEILPDNAKVLIARGYVTNETDFLTIKPHRNYDRVVMNPPFAKQADIKHVTHALQFLKPGGRLVAIMSSSITFRSDRRTKEFLDLVLDLNGEVTPLPEGSFASSGTMVNTVMVTANIDG